VHVVFAEIIGPDLLIVFAIVALLFGGSQLPKLARELGSASHEFRKGVEEGLSSSAGGVNTGDTGDTPRLGRRAARRARSHEADHGRPVGEDADGGVPAQLAVQSEV
jgi:sec-independent protein translocase protein TatA